MRHLNLLLLLALLALSQPGAFAAGFDLEVGISTTNPNPAIYSNVPFTVTATNAGDVAGTDVVIRLAVCDAPNLAFSQASGLVYTTTGSTATGAWDYINQRWTIPNLAPGQSATLTFTLFTLTNDPRSVKAFAENYSPADVDSTPGSPVTVNGVWACFDNDDDEMVLTLNGGTSPCSITASVSNIQCNDNGTPTNPNDDKYSFVLVANNPAPSAGYQVFIPQTSQAFNGTYGAPLTIQNIPISAGNLSLGLTDNTTGGCSATVPVTPPAPCSNGGQLPDFNLNSFFAVQPIAGGGSAVVEPNDQVPAGTTLNFPDHFAWVVFPVQVPTFNVAINAYLSTDATVGAGDVLVMQGSREINASTQTFGFTEGSFGPGPIPANTPPGNYFLILKYDATNLVAESNEGNNTKSVPIVVTAAPSGSIDLALSLAQPNTAPVIYSNYTVTATLTNSGQQTATGVKVKWAKPNGTVYTGGNEYVSSQGSFNPNGDQVWTVGSVPAGGVATLSVSYFLLQNGAPATYAQVTAATQQDVDSTPNNGTPPSVNEDDEAATGSSPPPVLTPDLTITNPVVTNAPIQPGQVLTYNFDLKNMGNGPASADFKVRAWISTSPNFNTSGIQDGTVPTGNYPAGFGVTGVPGASTIPANLPNGQYFLHLWVDADQAINESNESNNYATTSFLVNGTLQPGACDELLGGGGVKCLSHNAAGQLEITYQPVSNLRRAVLDATGQAVSDQSIGADPPITTYRVAAGNIEKIVGVNILISQPIPPNLLTQYDYILNWMEYNGGYLFFGYKNANSTVYAIRTNSSFVIQQAFSFGGNSTAWPPLVTDPVQVSASEVALILRKQPGQFNMETIELIVLNPVSTNFSVKTLTQGGFYSAATLKPNPCGGYSLYVFSNISFCVHGACYLQERREGRFVNGLFVTDALYYVDEFTAYGQGNRSQRWEVRTSDGGTIIGSHFQLLPLNPNPLVNSVHLRKMLNGVEVWTKDVTVASAASVRWLAMSGDELFFLSEKTNAVFVESLDCIEGTPPPGGCGAITITLGANKITIAGASAPHVLIKVFRSNWTLAFECLDNCGSPTVVSGLSTGTYFIQVKLINAGWGEICYLEQTVNVSNLGGGGGNALARDDDRQRLTFDNIYPSPAKYTVTLAIFSKEYQPASLDFYDAMGRAVQHLELDLAEGQNKVEVDVSIWRSGTYTVIGRGGGMPAYGRFEKVWEE